MRELGQNILIAICGASTALIAAAVFFAIGWYAAVQLAASTPLPV
jgi:hypothetical protein